MATRQYDFVSTITSATAPDPGTPSASADIVTKGYADGQYAIRDSWYDSVADNTAMKAISTTDRVEGQLAFNIAKAALYYFDSGSSATDDDDLVLQPTSGTGRWIKSTTGSGSASGETLDQNFESSVASGILSGENIAIREAVCIELHNGSGSDVYRMFKADDDLITRRSFAGFATSAATGTTGSYTYTIDAAYVSGNVIPIDINGRDYSVNYATSSDATLQALSTAIATDQDVTSAAVTVVGGNQTGTDDRVITITPKGHLALNITGTTITGGASQPGVTIAQVTAPVGAEVDLRTYGPLSGFSSLTPGAAYYLSSTAGGITVTPAGTPPVYVGRAMTSTVLFIDPNGLFTSIWGTNALVVRSHGHSTADTDPAADVEYYNFTAWAAGTSDSSSRSRAHGAHGTYNGEHFVLDGQNSSSVSASLFRVYNKASWASETALGTARSARSVAGFGGYIYANKGAADASAGNVTTASDRWNGSSWTSANAFSAPRFHSGTILVNSLMNVLGGFDAASNAQTTHETKNSSDTVSSATAIPTTSLGNNGGNQATNLGIINQSGSGDSTQMYSWNGSSWSSAITATYTVSGQRAAASASAVARGYYFQNGGRTEAGSSVTTSMTWNNIATASSTASSNARAGACGSFT